MKNFAGLRFPCLADATVSCVTRFFLIESASRAIELSSNELWLLEGFRIMIEYSWKRFLTAQHWQACERHG